MLTTSSIYSFFSSFTLCNIILPLCNGILYIPLFPIFLIRAIDLYFLYASRVCNIHTLLHYIERRDAVISFHPMTF